MNIIELVKVVKNDVKQGAYEQEEILLLCTKVEKMINHLKEIRELDWLPMDVDDLAKDALEMDE